MLFPIQELTLILLLFCTSTFAAKDYLFKKCSQNGFCHRNRHFASQVASFGQQYEPRYSIDRASIKIDESSGTFNGIINKQLADGSYVDLVFDFSIIQDFNLRFQLDEKERKIKDKKIKANHKRYNEASKWAFSGGDEASTLNLKPFQYQTLDDAIVLRYGENLEYTATIDFYPFRVTISYNGKEQIIMNDRNFLNMEHYRTKPQQNNNIDFLPEESKFNAFKDSFRDSRGDTLPFGPESVASDFTFVNYTSVYGIPEHADSLSLKDTTHTEPYRLYNVDIFEYDVQSKLPMYGSIPLMIAVKPDVTSAIFWVNSADTYIDIKKETHGVDDREISSTELANAVKTHWMSENGVVDVVFIVKPKPADVSRAYAEITGFTKLPNLFSIGYHQCRWNYNTEEDVLDVHANFDAYEIPYDTIWLDIEYTDNKKYFTWDNEKFPNYETMMLKLDETRRQLVVIIDPHLKKGYHISDSVIKNGIGIKSPQNDKTFHGQCWPGESVWIDTLNPEAQSFWDLQFQNGSELSGYSQNTHLWNDMNEPSVFNGPETSLPKDLLHYGNFEHRSVHNLYGLTFHESTYNSLLARNPNQRPFVLTRAFFAGSQRTAAMWSGDNMSRWEHLKESIPMVLTMNIAGFPFTGADVGGYFGNPSKELLVRWYQTGIWYPFFRAHAHIDSRRREPWMAGGQYTDIMRDTIKLRYKLLPIFYTEFWQNSKNGDPIIKPLVWQVPNDMNTYEIDNQFFMGGLLVRPIVEENEEEVDVYLPCDNATYFDFFDHSQRYESCQNIKVNAGLDKLPIFMKSGNVFATKDRYRRSAQLMKYDPYTLTVVLGADGHATGRLYIDDGETFGYELGDWVEIEFNADDAEGSIKANVDIGDVNGVFFKSLQDNEVKINKIVIIGSGNKISDTVEVNQDSRTWESEVISHNEQNHFVIRNPGVLISGDWEIKY